MEVGKIDHAPPLWAILVNHIAAAANIGEAVIAVFLGVTKARDLVHPSRLPCVVRSDRVKGPFHLCYAFCLVSTNQPVNVNNSRTPGRISVVIRGTFLLHK